MKQFIKDFKRDDKVQSVFLLKKKELLKTKSDKPYLRLVLSDKTGTIEGKMWDDAASADKLIDSGHPVYVKGSVDHYKDIQQVKVDDIRIALDKEYSPDDLMRTVENAAELFERIVKFLKPISEPRLESLAGRFLDDKELMERFKRSPGAKSWHNAYIGGLMEHTYEVMSIVDKVCELYPEADRDICILGAFLHDIGKVAEIDPKTFEYTIEGGLIGHLSIGFEMLSEKIRSIKDFPHPLALRIKHLILSHHGEYEQQSPILPKTLEATIVYHADELVSQANGVKEVLASQAFANSEWSNFITIKNRKYLIKKP